MNYITIKLPEQFVERYIDNLLENGENGFSSRSEIVKAALRSFDVISLKKDHKNEVVEDSSNCENAEISKPSEKPSFLDGKIQEAENRLSTAATRKERNLIQKEITNLKEVLALSQFGA